MNLTQLSTKSKTSPIDVPREELKDLQFVVFEVEGEERRYLYLPAWADPINPVDIATSGSWTPHQSLAWTPAAELPGRDVLNILYNGIESTCRGPACKDLREAKYSGKKFRTGVVIQARAQAFALEVIPL